MRLWEVDHDYLCETAHGEGLMEYKSWAEFLGEWGGPPLPHYNLLFRWDWEEKDDEEQPTYTGDDYYRNGRLKLEWMQQRKGRHVTTVIDVCRADEPAVRAYLEPFWVYMRDLWAPLA